MEQSPLVEMTGISVAFGPVQALQSVDLRLYPGEVHALMGENGAGKSTLIKALTGVYPVDAGQIHVLGEPVAFSGPAAAQAAGVSTVYQEVNLCPNLTVGENLRMATYGGVGMDEVEEIAYSRFPRLGERRTQVAGTLSGGEQQMLAIARALMSRPRLLLVDEASLGLSPALTQTVFSVVDRINNDGVTVVLVEQNVGVLPYADRALIMEKGTLVYEGSGDEIHSGSLRETYLGTPA